MQQRNQIHGSFQARYIDINVYVHGRHTVLTKFQRRKGTHQRQEQQNKVATQQRQDK